MIVRLSNKIKNNKVKLLTFGLVISFLGTLPLGSLNITAFQLAATKSTTEAISFSIAAILIELLVVRFTLSRLNKVTLNNKTILYLLPFAFALLMYLAVSNFLKASSSQPIETSSNLVPIIKSSFLLGLLLSSLNPMQIPFWIGWNNVLKQNKTLSNKPGMFTYYISGIGIGSIFGFLIFIFSGNIIFQNYQHYNHIISFAMGCFYLAFAFYLLIRFYKFRLKPIN